MLSLDEKIQYLENYLTMPTKNYADTFKEDIIMFLMTLQIKMSCCFFLINLIHLKKLKIGQTTYVQELF